ncbi:aminotransferase class I/II-fold pyridoxal phosphate-dependent enzyme, partial [bacterium]|nr:aminotransferase class I/II-fold pyridoxal phosphate-dependent enzyme [bacterium]
MAKNDLALFGGPKAVSSDHEPMFHWPIVLQEDEDAVLEVLRAGTMSGIDVTQKLEKEIAEWHGMEFALGHNTGTQALQAAMFACEVGKGDEIICPSVTYWASCLQVMNLRGTVVFADILPDTLCIDPADIEHRITERTKAIMVVHYCGYPCDMDPILEIAKKHNIKVIEDVSHAQGGRYKGRLNGTMGDVCAFS